MVKGDGKHSSQLTGKQFDFKKPDDWPRWKRRFDQFCVASGLAEAGDPRQVSTLLYCMGQDAEGVLTSTKVTDEERKKYDTVVAKFEEFFNVRRTSFLKGLGSIEGTNWKVSPSNSILQLYIPWWRRVSTGLSPRRCYAIESLLVYETRACHLQAFPDLMLDKAKRETRQREAVKEQHQELRGDGSKKDLIIICRVSGGKPGRQRRNKRRETTQRTEMRGGKPQRTDETGQQTREKFHCRRCGRNHQKDIQCPARNAICFKCNRKGHYGTQCFSKTVAMVAAQILDEEEDAAFLFLLSTNQESAWSVSVRLDNKEIPFKLDTGEEVTAISEEAYQMLQQTTLQNSSRILCGPTSKAL